MLSIITISCDIENNEKQFTLLNNNQTGIDFNNQLNEDNSFNYFTYPYIYMGGGVSVGDINNDNLDDIYSSLNSMIENKKFIELGKNAKEFVSKFQWEKILEEYKKILN